MAPQDPVRGPLPAPYGGTPVDASALLAALLADVVDTVLITDATGHVLRASASARSLLGWAPDELVGQNVRVLVPEPHGSQHDEYIERYARTGRTWILGTTREFEVLRRDGSLVPCELSVSRIDPEGLGAPLFCGFFRDVSDRRRTREALARSEARFRAVFENANELVLLVDSDGRIEDANRPTFERTLAERASLIGSSLSEAPIWTPQLADRESVVRALEQALAAGTATIRVDVLALPPRPEGGTARRAHARPTPAEVSIRRISGEQPGVPRALVEIRDISALVEAQSRETAVLRSLARVGEETAMLAHELRSPVSALELALKAVARQLGEDERSILDDLTQRMRRLETLLRRTLSFSRPLELDLRAVAVRDAFGAALERESASLERSSVRVTVHVEEGTPDLRADAQSLDDLLSNLIRNACDVQPDGGHVRLSAWPGARDRIELIVEDTGPGIPPDQREDVFRPFKTTREDGTGLGLALVRKVAEEHGARIRLEDGSDGTGLRVVLDWPSAAVS